MSINWVMLSEADGGFTPLPGEQRLYTSPPRTALSLQSLNKFPGKQPYSLQSSAGSVYLTNRRVIYLPATPTPALTSFAAPILNLHDTHVAAPFFGPNIWTAIVQPVPGGNVPAEHVALELKMTFKDGGAFDFHSTYERIKERLQQAVDAARESGQLIGDGSETGARSGSGGLAGVDLDSVHLDQLPAYEDGEGRPPSASVPSHGGKNGELVRDDGAGVSAEDRGPGRGPFTPPSEPPPGYEETQRESVADELERRLRKRSNGGDVE